MSRRAELVDRVLLRVRLARRPVNISLMPVKIRNAPKTYITQWKRASSAAPRPMKMRAHDDRADDAPEQHAVLIDLRHRERREEDDEDEDVVDRQRLLDEVAGQELERLLAAELAGRSSR